jgi:hypothetical protein
VRPLNRIRHGEDLVAAERRQITCVQTVAEELRPRTLRDDTVARQAHPLLKLSHRLLGGHVEDGRDFQA